MQYIETAVFEWEAFLTDSWQTNVAIYRKCGEQLIDEAGLDSAIKLYFSNIASGSFDDDIRIYVDNRSIGHQELFGFALNKIQSIEDFSNCVQRETLKKGNVQFGVIVNNIGKYVPRSQQLASIFLKPMIEKLGVPIADLEMGVFAGNYKTTPFGIHRDIGNDNFTFCISGSKRFLLWPLNYFDLRRNDGNRVWTSDGSRIFCESSQYEKFRKDAFSVTINPGDILYWPDCWHTVDNETDNFHSSLSIGLWSEIDLIDLLTKCVQNQLKKQSKANQIATGYATGNQPQFLTDAAILFDIIDDRRTIENALSSWWTTRLSGGGFS